MGRAILGGKPGRLTPAGPGSLSLVVGLVILRAPTQNVSRSVQSAAPASEAGEGRPPPAWTPGCNKDVCKAIRGSLYTPRDRRAVGMVSFSHCLLRSCKDLVSQISVLPLFSWAKFRERAGKRQSQASVPKTMTSTSAPWRQKLRPGQSAEVAWYSRGGTRENWLKRNTSV